MILLQLYFYCVQLISRCFFRNQILLNSIQKAFQYLIHTMTQKFDLVIVGAGCVGIAAAYYALRMNRSVCIIEKDNIKDEKHFWSQSFIARQNRIQSNEEYMTRFIRASNEEWKMIQQDIGNGKSFVYRQGALWFGDKNVNTCEGNIRAAHETIMQINRELKEGEKKIQSLYIEKIIHSSPEYMKVFKPEHPNEWNNWSSFYQPEGGSVDMKASYDAFYSFIKSQAQKAKIYDNTTVVKHQCSKSEFKHKFTTSSSKVIEGKSVFVCTGIFTPHFLKDVMNYPHFVDNNYKQGDHNRQYRIEEYATSYLKIDEGYEKFYSHMPNFINFIKENSHEHHYTTYGFPFHTWDTLKNGYFIKMGTMAHKKLDSLEHELKYLKTFSFQELPQDDHRVKAVDNYTFARMNGISAKSPLDKHFPQPMIFYQGRQTLLDYLHRNDQTVVVQSGGWIVNEYPLLAKMAMQMLFNPNKIRTDRQEQNVVGNFLNRTRLPLKTYVNDKINRMNYNYPKNGEFNTVIIGAGCAGLYSAFRLNQAGQENVGVFDLSERISGGLKSFQIRRTASPIELQQMKYIPDKHGILNDLVINLGIPSISLPVEKETTQSFMKVSSMRNDYRMMDWQNKQQLDSQIMQSYRVKGHLLGMSAYQIISFSLYQILTAPENVGILTELFLQKTKEDIAMEKQKAGCLKKTVHSEDIYYRNWKNFVYQDKMNPLCYNVNLTLMQWNKIRQILLFRFPYQVKEKDIYECQEKVRLEDLYPLYKFGFQNVIESQFGHDAYKFVAEQNGYYSNTSNASYIDQVMIYLLDYGVMNYKTLSGGFDNINYAMASQLIDEQKGMQMRNGGIYLSHKLVNIQKVSNRYLLTFHVKNENTPVPMEDSFKCQLYSGVKKSKLNNLVHKGLASAVPLPDKLGFSSVQFMANKVILGMPKKSIQILYNQVDLLQQPLTNYEQFYRHHRRDYQSLLNYTSLKQQMPKAKKFQPLNIEDEQQVIKLIMKRELYYKNPKKNPQLSQVQEKKLLELSERCFYDTVISKLNIDMKCELQKIKRFTHDEPIVPKNLRTLTESSESMPAIKMILNFTKNWWDPIQRIKQSCEKPSENMNMFKTIQKIKGVSLNQLSIRHTLQVSLGQDNILMCTYNDRISTEFWLALHKNFQKVWTPKHQTLKQMKAGSQKQIITYPHDQNIYPAKEVVVREILKELSRIHNTQVKEQWLKECAYQFLGNDRFGAGSHHFYSGYYIPTVMKCMRKPWKNESIHFVGQAFSNTGGWVEGAFQTSELLMQEQFGLHPLVKGYYAGY